MGLTLFLSSLLDYVIWHESGEKWKGWVIILVPFLKLAIDPTGIYLFIVNDENTTTMCELYY